MYCSYSQLDQFASQVSAFKTFYRRKSFQPCTIKFQQLLPLFSGVATEKMRPKYSNRNTSWMHSTPLYSIIAEEPFPLNAKSYSSDNAQCATVSTVAVACQATFYICFCFVQTIKTTCSPQDGTALIFTYHIIRETKYADKTTLLRNVTD